MSNDKYILDGTTTVPEPDLMKWAQWYETADRKVAKHKFDDVTVSTVFLGLDHSDGDGDPLLFETMIFGGKHDQFQVRCSTWDQAVTQHEAAVAKVRADQ